jgi:phosphoglycolate phosphatase
VGIKAVILDFDDTLFMTEQVAFTMENEAARRMELPPMTRDLHLATWGEPIEEAVPARFPGIDVPRFLDLYARVIVEFAASGELDALTEANITALTTLTKAGYSLFAVTSRQQGEVEHLLDASHALQKYLSADALYHCNRTRYRKPDPRVFDELLESAHLQPSDCLYVGDSTVDARAAKGAGMLFVACLESGLRSREDFRRHSPDGYIDKFADIPRWLAKHLETTKT